MDRMDNMIPNFIKYITISQNDDLTYNAVCIADLSDGTTTYEDCELIIPNVVLIEDNAIAFPYYNNEEETLITIAIPELEW